MNTRSVILLALIVLGIVGGAMWFLQTQPAPQGLPAPLEIKATPAPAGERNAPAPSAPLAQRPAATPRPAADPAQKADPAPPRAMTDWEVKIDQVLQAKVDEAQAARMLINLLPTLPADGQAEAAQHISNLVLDENYSQVLPLVRNPALPEEVHDVFVTDLLNREDRIKLPALLEIAKIPNHPYHEEARTDLEVFLDEDYGNDWAKWDAALKDYLRKQALEEAGAAVPGTPQAVPAPVQQ
jgi:hypothetical protein